MLGRGRKPALAIAAALLLAGGGAAQAVLPDLGTITGALGLGPAPAAPAPAAAPAGYEAFASGSVIHAGTLAKLLSVDVARSAVGTSETGGRPAPGDLGRAEVPALAARGSYAHGVGLMTGLGSGGAAPSQAGGPVSGAEASAPPNSGVVRREGTPIDLLGLVRGALLSAEAQARAAQTGCLIGSDLSHARGEAGDIALVGAASMGGAGLPLSHSVSRTVVVPGEPGRLALRAETRQRISPVTFLVGTPSQFTIHTEGEWMLRTQADGQNGSVTFGPADTGSEGVGRAVRVLGASGEVLAEGFPAGNGAGLRLSVAGLAEIVVGEAPRAPGAAGPAVVTGQRVAAAVDLIRVRLLGQDLRVGHMEASVAVPAGGMQCPAAQASVDVPSGTVDPGGEFPVTVRVSNPNDGVLTVPTFTARLAAEGAAFEVLPEDGAQAAGAALTWPAFSVPAGGAVERHARVRVGPASGPGAFHIDVNGDGSYGPETGTPAGSGAVVPVALRAAVQGPSVTALPVVPEVVGRRVVEAQSVLEAAGYQVRVVEQPAEGTPGVVLGQHPTGRVPRGALVTLAVPARRVAAASPPKVAAAPVAPRPVAAPAPAAPPPTPAAAAPAPRVEPAAPPVEATPAPEPPAAPAPEARIEPPPRETQAAPPTDDDEDGSRWLWGFLAVAMIAGVVAAARRTT
jgi:hypothetical protein